jgi:hypothetical protein
MFEHCHPVLCSKRHHVVERVEGDGADDAPPDDARTNVVVVVDAAVAGILPQRIVPVDEQSGLVENVYYLGLHFIKTSNVDIFTRSSDYAQDR